MFMDISSEMIHSLLPIFLVTVLGVSTLSVGIIEGIAEATASITKVFAGAISDWTGRRKPLVLIGYGMAALTKPLFPLAQGVAVVLLARFVDRMGKGIRGAPRDALVADLTPKGQRGAAYGLRQAMDTVGAFAGPGLALIMMMLTGDDFRLVFWIAVAPAFMAVGVILFGVHEPEAEQIPMQRRFPIRRQEMLRLDAAYWGLVVFTTFLTLARFSEAFLLLRAQDVGLAESYIPGVLIVMNVVYAIGAYPFGQLSDRVGRRGLLGLGIGFLVVADLILAAATNTWLALAGAAVWGLHMAATQGLLATIVADAAPEDLRGTAFGIFNLITGLGLLLASALAGLLWTALGPSATFLTGASLSAAAMIGLLARARAAGPAQDDAYERRDA
jgi:MFS family permease